MNTWLRTLLFMSIGFIMLGPLPRRLGIIGTAPQYTTLVWWMDTVAFIVFAAIIAALVWQWLGKRR